MSEKVETITDTKEFLDNLGIELKAAYQSIEKLQNEASIIQGDILDLIKFVKR